MYTYNILLGVNQDREPMVWNWKSENALAIVGKGGSGKTTAAIYWMAQLAAQGVRFLLVDPHRENKESLYQQTHFMHDAFIKPCVHTYEDAALYIEYIQTLGKQRIDMIIPEEDHYPLVLVIDEFTSFIINYAGAKQSVLQMLDSINQFRKVRLRLMLIGQSWGQAVRVVSGLRDAISSVVVLRSSFNDAQKFTSFAATAKEAALLKPGEGYYLDEKIYIPRITTTGKLTVTQRIKKFEPKDSVDLPQGVLYQNEHLLTSYGS